METLLILGILTSGYYISNNKKSKSINKNNIVKDNTEDITIDDVTEYELKKNTENIEKSKTDSDIIPPLSNEGIFSTLTGTNMTEDEFKHNNMVPFFKGATAPGTNYKNDQLLERFTGSEEIYQEKKEREPLFAREKDFTHIHGYTKDIDDMKQRMGITNIRTNESPFEKVRVGPGLNQGYTSEPSGGFHQNTRDYTLPKNVDELRVLTNPKKTYDGRIIQGKAINDLRAEEGCVEKNRPDTFYISGPERWNTTVGAFTKERKRPCVIIKDTNRKKSRTFFGPAVSDYEKHKLKPKFKKSTKNIFAKDWMRNVYADDKWNNIDVGDYGKESFVPSCNERDVTVNRTHILNPQSVVKALFAPLLDEIRRTKKENVIGNIRQSGNVQITGPSNLTIYDPNDVARTTMKEVNIDNKHTGNVGNVQNGDGYKVADMNAPNTNRQFTEELRKPTQVKEKLFAGGDKVEIDMKKIESDYYNQTPPKQTKVYNSIPEANECEVTNQKDQLDNKKISDRLNSCMVDAFEKNPYTQSLKSYAF